MREETLKKFDIGQILHTLANLGVIAGIVFLVVELRQNNEFLELEAKATQLQVFLDGWEQLASDTELVALMIKDRDEQELTSADELRLNAFWMGYFMRREWQYDNVESQSDLQTGAFLRAYNTYGSMRRAWEGGGGGSVAAGKDNFSSEFVAYIEMELASAR